MSAPPRLAEPFAWAGCYTINAYCDRDHETSRPVMCEGNGETRAQAMRQVRKRGWRFNPDGTATCAHCVKAGAEPVTDD